MNLGLIPLDNGSLPAKPDIKYNRSTNTIDLDSISLEDKIAQTVITYDDHRFRDQFKNMVLGGIFLRTKPTKQKFKEAVKFYQKNSTIKYFTVGDLEGCVNPFEKFKKFTAFENIENETEAFHVARSEGKLMEQVGFNMNFAPVVDLKDNIWECRSFPGNYKEIANKSAAYVRGLQSYSVLATAKHYPGSTLESKDPHQSLLKVNISEQDLLPFKRAIENNVSAIMTSHQIAEGEVSSNGKPATVSRKLVRDLRENFSGLIVTDAISMNGLTNFYDNQSRMYIDLYKAGNDLILNLRDNYSELNEMIQTVEAAVKEGEIDEDTIDSSVIRILNFKGYNVLADGKLYQAEVERSFREDNIVEK